MIGDLNLIQIDNFIETVIFTSVRQGARTPTFEQLDTDHLILLQKNSFLSVGINEEFVESITQDELTQSIYFCTREELYKVQVTPTGVSISELISRIQRGYFQIAEK